MNARFRAGILAIIILSISMGWAGLAATRRESPQETPAAAPPADLSKILAATGDYCEIVKRMALYFVCQERIVEKTNTLTRGAGAARTSGDQLKIGSAERRNFDYEYQIIKNGSDIQEKRTLVEENGKKRHAENADLPTLSYSGRNLVFGPVGFLSRYWQAHFNYEITGRETVNGKTAIVIRATPKTESQENNNHGRVWVDASTYQILRIELEPQIVPGAKIDPEEKADRISDSADLQSTLEKFHRQLVWIVDYGIEKKSVLFPSRQMIREFYVSDMGFQILKREVSFDYSDYKYFTVETEVH